MNAELDHRQIVFDSGVFMLVCKYLGSLEMIRIQKVSRLFYIELIPKIMKKLSLIKLQVDNFLNQTPVQLSENGIETFLSLGNLTFAEFDA